jgi:RHS repeat-associated protein
LLLPGLGREDGHTDYVWLNDTPLVQEERSYGSLGAITGTQTTWLHVDHLNTPRIGTDVTQTIVWRWDSDPLGVGEPDTDPDADTTDHVISLRFPGQYADEESGHFYNYFRDYDPIIGRYTASDPIGVEGGLNVYGYVGGNPICLSE